MTGTVRTWSAPHSAVERPRLFALHGMRCNRSGAERSADQGSRPRHHSLPGDTVRSCRRRTLEVHNEAAFENAFRCRSVALSAAPLIIGKVKEIGAGWPICVVSPDLGGGKRADLLREVFERAVGHPVGKAFVEKHRSSGVVSGDLFAGDVANMLCVVVDDLVSTGGTLVRAAKAAPAHGAQEVIACVAHGVPIGNFIRVTLQPESADDRTHGSRPFNLVCIYRVIPVASVAASRDLDASSSTQRAAT